jgi:chromate reductase
LSILAIVGSLRSGSVNRSVARAAAEVAPEGVNINIHEIGDIPLFNEDLEVDSAPRSVTELHDAVGQADAIIFFTPEYNGSFPAVTKNVLDWLTREPGSLQGTPATAIAMTPGARAGAGVLGHFDQVFAHMRGDYRWHPPYGIGSYPEKIDSNGALVDPATLDELAGFLTGFREFVGAGSDG